MKNYGLQVKEIPIIFRGMIDGAQPVSSVDPIITDENPEYYWDGDQNCYLCDFGSDEVDLTEKEKLYIQLGSEIYELETKTLSYGGMTLYYWGDTIVDPTQPPTFSEYPFLIMKQPMVPGAYVINAESELTPFNVWLEDPRSGDLTPTKKIFSADLTGNGQINRFYARFACGENGTLHLKPYVILNGNIRVDLCNFAQGGDQYIAGDNETISFDCFVPVETHAVAYVEAENVGEYPSVIDAAMVVQYEDFIESESIVGYEGINLRRR